MLYDYTYVCNHSKVELISTFDVNVRFQQKNVTNKDNLFEKGYLYLCTYCEKRILMIVPLFEIVDGVSRLSSSVTCEQLKVIMFLCLDNS
jgi:hypothetical protein